jgi:hypothetical protein
MRTWFRLNSYLDIKSSASQIFMCDGESVVAADAVRRFGKSVASRRKRRG